MTQFSQNKKIAVSAIALFIMSFTMMLFVLENADNSNSHNKADVLHVGEQAKEDLDAKYKEYVQDQDAPMFVTDAEGNILYSGEDFCELLGIPMKTLEGVTLFDIINSKDLPDLIADHAKILQNGEKVEGMGPYRMIKGKEEILLIMNAYPILEDKKVLEVVFSVKDITEQVEELNEEKMNPKWLEDLYPKIKDMEHHDEVKMIVDKISFKGGSE